MKFPLVRSSIALAICLTGMSSARASQPPDISDAERGLLPRYCYAVQLGARNAADREQYDRYVAQFGRPWTAMHHYCWALVDIIRLERARRTGYSAFANPQRALGNLEYVLRWTAEAPEFPMRPEILQHKVRLLARIGKRGKAAEAARQMISERPTLPEGYVLLANLLLEDGKREAAREVLRRGDGVVTDRDRYEKLKYTMRRLP